jgi:hypothetical protein
MPDSPENPLQPIVEAIRRGVPLAAIIAEFHDGQEAEPLDLSSVPRADLHLFDGCALLIPPAVLKYLDGIESAPTEDEFTAAEQSIASYHGITPETGFRIMLEQDLDKSFHATLLQDHA